MEQCDKIAFAATGALHAMDLNLILTYKGPSKEDGLTALTEIFIKGLK
jgi:hypothetical protein